MNLRITSILMMWFIATELSLEIEFLDRKDEVFNVASSGLWWLLLLLMMMCLMMAALGSFLLVCCTVESTWNSCVA